MFCLQSWMTLPWSRNAKRIPWFSSSPLLWEGSQSPPEICQSHRTFQTHSRWTSASCLTTCATPYSVSESTTLNHLILRHLHSKMRNHTRLNTTPRANCITTTPHLCFHSVVCSVSTLHLPCVCCPATWHLPFKHFYYSRSHQQVEGSQK